MRFLERERRTLRALIPGLDERIAELSLSELERPGGLGLVAFKEAGGPGLLVPKEYGGAGAGPVDALRVQCAIGTRSPSLAVATTMHHFSVASLIEAASSALEMLLVEAIAKDRLLLASGFAEGRTGASILAPTITAEQRGKSLVVSGSKKPCSLSRSMDLLTCSVTVADEAGREQLAVALIPAASPGLTVKPFWNAWVLTGAESDEVVLAEVEVPEGLVVRTETTEDGRLDDLQRIGFLWFELLITASYLGMACALVERVLADGRASAEGVGLATAASAAMLTLDGLARRLRDQERGPEALADALAARYAVQDTIGRIARKSVELLGGMAYIGSGDVAYLAAATAALAFHPPSRVRMTDQLREYYADGPLRVI